MPTKIVSTIMLALLLMSMLTLAFNIQLVQATGTIYIRADGSIDPPTPLITTVDNVTYTLNGSIIDSIIVERDSIVLDGAGYVLKAPYTSSIGIDLTGRNNVTIKNVTVAKFDDCGIMLNYSSSNILLGNKVTNNRGQGIRLEGSSSNVLSGNTVTGSGNEGIELSYSSNNTLSGNNVENNGYGIALTYSCNNTLSGNNVASSKTILSVRHEGFRLMYSSGNILSGNDIVENSYGVELFDSSSNSIFHNDFVNNNFQVYFGSDSANIWDNAYPSGGNYWSDSADADLYGGIYQNLTGSDEISDTPYIIDANNTDHYPLMKPYTGEPYPKVLVDPQYTSLVVGQELTVTVNATRVSAMDGWQVALKYNGTILNCTGIWVPEDNVFAGHETLSVDPGFGVDFYDGQQYVLYGCVLRADNVSVTNGILCKLKFTALSTGTTPLSIATLADPAYVGPRAYDAFYSMLLLFNITYGEERELLFIRGRSGGVNVRLTEGDIDLDGRVDMKDIGIVAVALGSYPGHPRWKNSADENKDGKIDLKDIAIVAKNFGKTYL